MKWIEASGNATVKLTDTKGFEQERGTLAYDDRLVVTLEDMTKTVTYYLDFPDELNPDHQKDPTTIRINRSINTEPLLAYPNPTDNQFYLKGLSEGEVIYVTDIMGRTLQISSSEEINDGITLTGQPIGIYLIITVDRDHNIRRARVVKR